MAMLSRRTWSFLALSTFSTLPAGVARLALVSCLTRRTLLSGLSRVPCLPSLAGLAHLSGLALRARWSLRCRWRWA